MSIENPISTIKKAVQVSAEKLAETELLNKPEQRHYKSVFENYRMIKNYNPELLERVVLLFSKWKDLNNKLGSELSNVLKNVSSEIDIAFQNKIISATEQLKQTSNLSEEALQLEAIKLTERVMAEIVERIRSDSRIVTGFSEKEELLIESLNLLSETHLGLLRIINEYAP